MYIAFESLISLTMQYHIYILFSENANKYYVGYSPNPQKRLNEHNSYLDKKKFTSKYQPWILVCSFPVSQDKGEALKIERFIKKQKSKKFTLNIIANHKDTVFIQSIIAKALSQSGPDKSGLIRRS